MRKKSMTTMALTFRSMNQKQHLKRLAVRCAQLLCRQQFGAQRWCKHGSILLGPSSAHRHEGICWQDFHEGCAH